MVRLEIQASERADLPMAVKKAYLPEGAKLAWQQVNLGLKVSWALQTETLASKQETMGFTVCSTNLLRSS